VVSVKHPAPGGSIQVTLSRLEGNTNGGIWIVTGVQTPGMSITAPQGRDLLTSPLTVSGTGSAFEGIIGTVTVLDHLYTDIGNAQATSTQGMGSATFSTNIAYTSTFKGGAQEGLIALYSHSNADGSISGAVIIKELLK
ncbi:MAG TPA: Gmad2 immunoglobulin-like domain-containing protein, partial [Ktedonobacteraceae bacterium]|nr:Gmad2 immunoglobulin-like domain-containing protein [Ktedonobacteraceae bacterium]